MKSTTALDELGGPLLAGETSTARRSLPEDSRTVEHWIAGALAAEWTLGADESADLEREARP
jgi:hypothetical protein